MGNTVFVNFSRKKKCLAIHFVTCNLGQEWIEGGKGPARPLLSSLRSLFCLSVNKTDLGNVSTITSYLGNQPKAFRPPQGLAHKSDPDLGEGSPTLGPTRNTKHPFSTLIG